MARPKYGMMTNPGNNPIREIKLSKNLGFDYVELGMEIPEGHFNYYRKNQKKVLDLLKRFNHPPVCHTAHWAELWTEYERVRMAWIGVMKESIDVSRSLGCTKFNIHSPILHGLYNHSDKQIDKAVKIFIKSMKELVGYSENQGIEIVLENMPMPEIIPFKKYKHILDSVPGLKSHIDVAHSFIEDGMRGVRKYLKTFSSKLEHLHICDNLGLSDDHLGIGMGIIDYVEVMQLLRDIGYDKTITLEVFSGKADLKDSLKIVRAIEGELWPK